MGPMNGGCFGNRENSGMKRTQDQGAGMETRRQRLARWVEKGERGQNRKVGGRLER